MVGARGASLGWLGGPYGAAVEAHSCVAVDVSRSSLAARCVSFYQSICLSVCLCQSEVPAQAQGPGGCQGGQSEGGLISRARAHESDDSDLSEPGAKAEGICRYRSVESVRCLARFRWESAAYTPPNVAKRALADLPLS